LKISSGKAKSVKELPRFDIVCPAQNFQKSALGRWAAGDAVDMGLIV